MVRFAVVSSLVALISGLSALALEAGPYLISRSGAEGGLLTLQGKYENCVLLPSTSNPEEQQWMLQSVEDGYVTLENLAYQQFASVEHPENGALVNGNDTLTRYRLDLVEDGQFRLVLPTQSFVMDVSPFRMSHVEVRQQVPDDIAVWNFTQVN